MLLNVPSQACLLAILLVFLSGMPGHACADDLALETSDKKLTVTQQDAAADSKETEETENADEADDDNEDLANQIDPLMLIRDLNALRIKRAKYARNLGPGHPTIVSLTEQIQEIESQLKDAPEPSDPLVEKVNKIEDLSEKELREAVAMLINRVRDLEYDLQAMQREVNVIRQRR